MTQQPHDAREIPAMAHRRVALLLPGQGAQHAGMAVPLYEHDHTFAAIVEDFFDLMGEEGSRIRADWLGSDPQLPVDDGRRAQPLLFVIGYAIGRVLERRGIRPDVLLGHSVGELAAACLAGVFDLESAARIMLARSRVLATAPPGGMLAVAAAPERVESGIAPEWAERGVVVGAVNAPAQTVLAGPEAELALAAAALSEAGLVVRRVRAREPFHSPVLDEAALDFEKAVAAETLNPPRVEIRSARTARTVRPEEAVDPAFWARQMAEPILYWPALGALLDDGAFTFVEAGPGRSLSAPARRHPAVRSGRSGVVCTLPAEGGDCLRVWNAATEQLGALLAPEAMASG
ncbi:acyltransferase domain-containing protein [Streptomyces sp. NPDC048639]|uniref:acyltransferase domain-containing protein n=1 Tax=Streptomyces sp. NPDC048639 TaxID=3365581 RepID=UPI00371213AE